MAACCHQKIGNCLFGYCCRHTGRVFFSTCVLLLVVCFLTFAILGTSFKLGTFSVSGTFSVLSMSPTVSSGLFTHTHFRCADNPELLPFQPAMTATDLELLTSLLKALSDALNAAEVPYFMYGGTLIGSWRHHGLIPWDDDVDIAIDGTRRDDARAALEKLGPFYKFFPRGTISGKFFSTMRGQKVKGVLWTWPFIDIFFINQNSTHILESDRKNFPEYIFPKDWIFPTMLRPFNGLLLPAPVRTKQVLDWTYNISQCLIGFYSHRHERGKKKSELKTVPCGMLEECYSFVQREKLKGGYCNETLVQGDGTVSSWEVVNSSECV